MFYIQGSYTLISVNVYVSVGVCPDEFLLQVTTNYCVKQCSGNEVIVNNKCVESTNPPPLLLSVQ